MPSPVTGEVEVYACIYEPPPNRGSWLDIAEIELSASTRQFLDGRSSDLDVLNTALAAWLLSTFDVASLTHRVTHTVAPSKARLL